MNHCDECGLDFYYEPKYHECADKQRVLITPREQNESWVEECIRKQREGIKR
jgi:hypothetical protein